MLEKFREAVWRKFFGIACNSWLKSQEIERFGAAKGAGLKAF